MRNLHYVYLRYVMGELENDALTEQANRSGLKSAKDYLNLVVQFEIDRCRQEFKDGLSEAKLEAYRNPISELQNLSTDEDDEIPF